MLYLASSFLISFMERLIDDDWVTSDMFNFGKTMSGEARSHAILRNAGTSVKAIFPKHRKSARFVSMQPQAKLLSNSQTSKSMFVLSLHRCREMF